MLLKASLPASNLKPEEAKSSSRCSHTCYILAIVPQLIMATAAVVLAREQYDSKMLSMLSDEDTREAPKRPHSALEHCLLCSYSSDALATYLKSSTTAFAVQQDTFPSSMAYQTFTSRLLPTNCLICLVPNLPTVKAPMLPHDTTTRPYPQLQAVLYLHYYPGNSP